jgi:hypothetical protein
MGKVANTGIKWLLESGVIIPLEPNQPNTPPSSIPVSPLQLALSL